MDARQDPPLTAEVVASGALRLQQPTAEGDLIYWLEGRPQEKGRVALMCADVEGGIRELVEAPTSVRSRLHAYGGGAYAVQGARYVYISAGDQALHLGELEGGDRTVVTFDDHALGDLAWHPDGQSVFCVRERISDPDNRRGQECLVRIQLADGSHERVAAGHEFYGYPTVSACGRRLAYLTWDSPDMPWDRTRLWCLDLSSGQLVEVALGKNISAFQPTWLADGSLVFAADLDGFWHLQRWDGESVHQLTLGRREHAFPQWVAGMRYFSEVEPGVLLSAATQDGRWIVYRVEVETGDTTPLELPVTHIEHLAGACSGDTALLAGAPDTPITVWRLSQGTIGSVRPAHQVVERLDLAASLSRPETFSFTTGPSETAHAHYYPPVDSDGPAPLIVRCHGGPTSAAGTALELKTQFWTLRGFGVVEVNYRGSSGYGRGYRERLYGRWGIADVEDAAAAARALIERGAADPKAVFISGSSAGGYTVLRALMYGAVFRGGACYYGVADLEALARDTVRFEARYGDRLIAPYPAEAEKHRDLSPINHAEDLRRPVIFFQGSADEVVPPDQTRRMAAALRERGIAVEVHEFPEEGHGFRGAGTIRACLESELAFYRALTAG